MRERKLEKTLNISPEQLFTAWFRDNDFMTKLWGVMRIVTFDIELKEAGAWPTWKVDRRLTFDTDRDIPKALLKVVRGMTQVIEVCHLDSEARTLRVALTLPIIGRLTDYGYVYSWDAADEGSIHMRWTGHCDVRIPLIRNLAEKYLLDELTDATEHAAEFIDTWIDGDGS